jgi:hypothetical protein
MTCSRIAREPCGSCNDSCTMPVVCVTDTSSFARPSPVHSTTDAAIHATGGSICVVVADNTMDAVDCSGTTGDASPVPTAGCPPVDGVIVTSGVCPDSTVAIPAPPPLDSGMASIDNCNAPQKATLFFTASARGVMCQPALQHQQNIKPTTRPIKNDKGKGVRRVP